MAVLSLAQLKARFAATLTPSAADFADLVDTLAVMPFATSATATPVGPAGGGLTGDYPNPTVLPFSLGLDRLDPTPARTLAPSAGDIVVAVFEQSTGAFNYRNWNGLPGIAQGSGASANSPVTPPATTVGQAVLRSTGWRAFQPDEVNAHPFVYTDPTPIPAEQHIVQIWGEVSCREESVPNTDNSPNRTGYPAGTILPMSAVFTTENWPVGGDVTPKLAPYFNVFLTPTRHVSVSSNLQVPASTTNSVVILAQTSTPATRQAPVYFISPSIWQYRVQILTLIS